MLALLGQLFSTISSAEPKSMETDTADEQQDGTEELTEIWLRTVGIVAGAGAKGHDALSTAVSRSKWLENLRPALAQLRNDAGLDERVTEALQSLMA